MSNGSTNLQPNKLKSKNFLLNKSIDIDFNRIELSDNNTTVTISAIGLQNSNPTGLRMDCILNMNENNVTNVNYLGFYNEININDNYNNSIIGNNTDLTLSSESTLSLITTSGVGQPNHINIKSGSDIVLESENGVINLLSNTAGINLTSGDGTIGGPDINLISPIGGINLLTNNDMNFTANAGGLVATMDYIQLIATNQYINLDALNNITITSSNSDVNLDASNNINITSSNGEVNLSGISFNLSSTDSTISDSGSGLEITSTSSVSLISGTNEAIILNSGEYIEMNPNTYIKMDSGEQINLNTSLLFDIILDTSYLRFKNGIKITDDTENNKIVGTNDELALSSEGIISLTTTSGVGQLHNININSAGDILIVSSSSSNMTAPSGLYINTAGTNVGDGIIHFTGAYSSDSFQITTNDLTGDLVFTGTHLQSNSSGGNSGEHLRIKLNGVYYKIALQND